MHTHIWIFLVRRDVDKSNVERHQTTKKIVLEAFGCEFSKMGNVDNSVVKLETSLHALGSQMETQFHSKDPVIAYLTAQRII